MTVIIYFLNNDNKKRISLYYLNTKISFKVSVTFNTKMSAKFIAPTKKKNKIASMVKRENQYIKQDFIVDFDV